MTIKNVQPIVLAGGSGSRLWPLSTAEFPKQFRPLLGERSTFQDTLVRVSEPQLYLRPITITSKAHLEIADEQQNVIGVSGMLIAETSRRDSAAAVAVAALSAQQKDDSQLVLTLAADHAVSDADDFNLTVRAGLEAAQAGKVVVFGLHPTEPKTCYGYIKPGHQFGQTDSVSSVEEFVEKPDQATALEYFRKGYLWNSGNFLFRADVMVQAFERFAPEILTHARTALQKSTKLSDRALKLHAASFEQVPIDSIDYAIIEKLDNCVVVRGDFSWSDVGSWDAVWEVLNKNASGNSQVGQAHFFGSKGCFIHSEARPTVAVGMKDTVIITTDDAVLVLSKDKAQDIKKISNLLKK